MNESKRVKKVLNHLRKMKKWQRRIVLSWLEDWHSYEKEREEE